MTRFTLFAALAAAACVAGCTSETSDNAPISSPATEQSESQDNPIAIRRQGTLQRPGEAAVRWDQQSFDPQVRVAKIRSVTDTTADISPDLQR